MSLQLFLRGLAASVAAAFVAALVLVAGARWWTPQPLHGPVAEGAWTARSRALFTPTDFYRPEFDERAGRHYSWSGESSSLTFTRLNRSVAYLVTIDFRGGRPADVAQAELKVSVDGRVRTTSVVPGGSSQVQFEIPRAESSSAVVTLETSPVYRPGPPDPRGLGIIVDDVAITPVNGSFQPSAEVIAKTAVAVAVLALGLWLLGLRGLIWAAVVGASALGFAWLLLRDAAFFGTYVDRLLRIAIAGGVVAGLVGAMRARGPIRALSPEWNIAIGILLAATVLKLAAYWHPLAQVGDGLFQVHRAQAVHNGSYFFTSVTPRPFYEFPYPVALYVTALPFWNWFSSELDLLRLLRAVCIVADGLVGVALYAAVRRQFADGRPALFVAALWPLARAPLEALTNANLTNLFGQGVFGLAVGGVAWMAAGSTIPWLGLSVVLALLVVAFLSHFGTLTVGLLVLVAIAAVLLAFGRGHRRRVGAWVCALTIAASAISWFVYYSNPTFTSVYAKTYASITSRERDDTSKIDAAPFVKLQRWWAGVGDDYGRPGLLILIVALAGMVLVARQRPLSGAGLVFGAWMIAWIALSLLGIFTSVGLRANLATAPVFVVFGGIALGTMAARSQAGRYAAWVLFAAIAWDGWQIVTHCLDLSAGG